MKIIPISKATAPEPGTQHFATGLPITSQQIEAAVATTEFILTDEMMTLCVATLQNGYSVVGRSTPPLQAYDQALEQLSALEDVHRWVRPLPSYELSRSLWRGDPSAASTSGARSPARRAATLDSQTDPPKSGATTG